LCNLYNWRYKNLGNLPHVQLLPEFSTANAGLLYDFQLINVEDFQGVGESEPNPYFYQVRQGVRLWSLSCICLPEVLWNSAVLSHVISYQEKERLQPFLTTQKPSFSGGSKRHRE
jgi:hypothetical protein